MSTSSGTNTDYNSLNGLILAGGYGRRIGMDKGLLRYHDKPQREYLFETLKPFCEIVFTSCRADQNVPGELNPVFDSVDVPGPLNGILTAFSLRREGGWLTVAVDMPFVNTGVLQILVDARDRTQLATCFYNPETKQPEPLLTIWEREAYPFLRTFATEGNISPRAFLKTHRVKMINPPDVTVLRSLNYPEDIGG